MFLHTVIKWLIQRCWICVKALWNNCSECGIPHDQRTKNPPFHHLLQGETLMRTFFVSYFKNMPTQETPVELCKQIVEYDIFPLYAGSTAQFLLLIITICCSLPEISVFYMNWFLLDMRNSWQHNLTHCSVLLAVRLGAEKQQYTGTELGHY